MNNIEIFKKKTLDRGLFDKLTNIVENRGIDEAASFITILSDTEHRLTLEDAYIIANWALGNEEKTDIIMKIEGV